MSQTQKAEALLAEVQSRDRHRLRQQLRRARSEDERARVMKAIDESAAMTQVRARAQGAVSLVDGLPVTERADEIAAALREHQVVVVCGETGSGKTTQLPKLCLEIGRGQRGMIGHTQPRRLAARSVAATSSSGRVAICKNGFTSASYPLARGAPGRRGRPLHRR